MKWKKKSSILYHLTYNLSKSLCTSKSAIFYLFIYLFFYCSIILHIFPGSSGCKESPCHEEDLGSIPESGKSPQEGRELFGQRSLSGYSPWGEKKLDTTEWLTHTHTHTITLQPKLQGYTLVAQTVKRLPTIQETQVQSLGWEGLLENEIATHSSILAWKMLWMEEPGRLKSMESQRVGHNWDFTFTHALI